MRVRSILTALGLNAIPAAGWFLGDWSAGTTLVLYWFETLLGTLLVAARILVHRRLHPSKGHCSYQAPQAEAAPGRSSYLAAFLVPALVFTLAHGIFLAALGFMAVVNHLAPEARIERGPLLVGLTGLALFQLADFSLDLIWLRGRSFAWLERLGQQTLARVFVIHLTIIGGMAAVMFTGAGRQFFGAFIFLKTLLNCSVLLPQWQPKGPPTWLSRAMDHVKAPKNQKLSFAEFWKQTDDREVAHGWRGTNRRPGREVPAAAAVRCDRRRTRNSHRPRQPDCRGWFPLRPGMRSRGADAGRPQRTPSRATTGCRKSPGR